MNYLEWVKILGLAIRLIHAAEMDGGTELICHWEPVSMFSYIGPDSIEALVLELRIKENSMPLSEYAVIPRQNLYLKKTGANLNLNLAGTFFMTVTKEAVIIQRAVGVLAQENRILADRFDSVFKKLIEYDSCQALIKEESSFAIPGGLQVIRLREYPHYIRLEVAQPGSKAVQKSIPDGLPKNKMIQQYLIPDYGPIHEQWIFQPYEYPDSAVAFTDDSVRRIIRETFTEAVNGLPDYYRKAYFEQCRERIQSYLQSTTCYSAGLNAFWNKELKRLMFADTRVDLYEDIHAMFPDYEPKTTPDDVYDYRPSLSGKTESLPAAELDNLPSLLDSFSFYKKAAKKNPGTWNDGNMILGANGKEYRPSNEELILSDIGERIRQIVISNTRENIERVTKENRIKKKSLSYKKFTFRHCDVMGSGRFFYVDQIHEVKVELKK